MSRTPSAKIRQLVGRTIVAAEPNTVRVENHGGRGTLTMHDWTLTLDNGTRVSFMVEEHPNADFYGVDIVVTGPRFKVSS